VQVGVNEVDKTLPLAGFRVNRSLVVWINLDKVAIAGTAEMKRFLVDNHVLLNCRFILQRQENSITVEFCPWVRVVL
jgi:hypothetical protein